MPDSFLSWDPAQVSSFIKDTVGIDVAPQFIENNIDGSLLPHLTCDHLKELNIDPLSARLRIKKAITGLVTPVVNSAVSNPALVTPIPLKTHSAVSLEAVSLLTNLLRTLAQSASSNGSSGSGGVNGSGAVSADSVGTGGGAESGLDDVKRLNESFAKLRSDLFPLLRYLKDSKPLPTPTLDPGMPSASPTGSVLPFAAMTDLAPSSGRYGSPSECSGLPIPRRASSTGSAVVAAATATSGNTATGTAAGSVPPSGPHSTGTTPSTDSAANTLVPQNSSAPPTAGTMPNVGSNSSLHSSMLRAPPAPHSPSASNRFSFGSIYSMGVGKPTDISGMRSASSHRLPAKLVESRLNVALNEEKSSKERLVSPTLNGPSPGTQPLKQLKASSDDTCLKVLHQAMKRHHIPRHHWSKYVLVICYGDKERILKLTEKPVLIFKELQELGKNPAIMLRELAAVHTNEHEKYSDSRISDDIPGGTL